MYTQHRCNTTAWQAIQMCTCSSFTLCFAAVPCIIFRPLHTLVVCPGPALPSRTALSVRVSPSTWEASIASSACSCAGRGGPVQGLSVRHPEIPSSGLLATFGPLWGQAGRPPAPPFRFSSPRHRPSASRAPGSAAGGWPGCMLPCCPWPTQRAHAPCCSPCYASFCLYPPSQVLTAAASLDSPAIADASSLADSLPVPPSCSSKRQLGA